LISATGQLKTGIKTVSTNLTTYQSTPQLGLKTLLDNQMDGCKENVAIMEECTQHLQALLDDVLSLAKLGAKKIDLDIHVFQPKAMLQSVAKMFAAKVAEKKLQLHMQLPTDEILVKGDARRLKQVVINLLANALKFTEKGSVTLALNVLRVTITHTQLQFVVVDTGIGMTMEEKACLFKPFSQVSGDIATLYGGTGLGLEISDKFIRLMNSQITVESKKGEGTQFIFVIEFANPAPTEMPLAGNQINFFKTAAPTATKLSAGKILIADDNSINQKILARMLQNLGYAVQTANNGLEAVQYYIDAGPFSLIFMDMEMPKMKGDEATKQIRQIEQERHLSPIPIICITGHGGDEYQQQILQAGMNAILIKPFSKEKICQIIASWVKAPPTESTSQTLATQKKM
jgi:CheY-like chemotaxis protein